MGVQWVCRIATLNMHFMNGCTVGECAESRLIDVSLDVEDIQCRGNNHSRLKLPSPIICHRTPSA